MTGFEWTFAVLIYLTIGIGLSRAVAGFSARTGRPYDYSHAMLMVLAYPLVFGILLLSEVFGWLGGGRDA